MDDGDATIVSFLSIESRGGCSRLLELLALPLPKWKIPCFSFSFSLSLSDSFPLPNLNLLASFQEYMLLLLDGQVGSELFEYNFEELLKAPFLATRNTTRLAEENRIFERTPPETSYPS